MRAVIPTVEAKVICVARYSSRNPIPSFAKVNVGVIGSRSISIWINLVEVGSRAPREALEHKDVTIHIEDATRSEAGE